MVPLARPLQVDAAVLVALALQPFAEPDLAQQVDRRLLEDAGADPRRDVFLRPALDHHGLDALAVEQVREQHPRRPGPDDRDPGALLLHGSSTAAPGGRERGAVPLSGRVGSRIQSASVAVIPPMATCLVPRWGRRCLAGDVEQLPTTWRATWVSPTAEPTRPGRRPAYRLRGELTVDRPVRRATLFATAHGIYEAALNGVRVGDDELTPGYTEYQHHTQVQSYDVTDVVRDGGEHARRAARRRLVPRPGRHDPRPRPVGERDGVPRAARARARRRLDHRRWAPTRPGSGRRATSRVADLIEGQHEDRRLARASRPGHRSPPATAGTTRWSPRRRRRYARSRSCGRSSVTELRPGVHVVDLGQNINGRVRLTDLGPEGTELVLTHAEALGPDGDVTTDHLAPDVPFLPEPLTAGQVDRVVSAGVDGDVFEPRFTTHGFRYVRIEGHPGPLTADDVTGVVVHTDLERRGSFRVQRRPAQPAARRRRVELPRQRLRHPDRLPDPRACRLDRRLAAVRADRDVPLRRRRLLPEVAARPRPSRSGRTARSTTWSPMPVAERTGFLERLNGSAGWGDAVVLVPWELYQEYGDPQVLRDAWPAMVRWLDRAERMATTERHPDREARHPSPRPHDRYLWDTGFHWGEWLVPGEDPSDFPAFVAADKADIATAFYAWSTRHAAEIARLLGRGRGGREVRRAERATSSTPGSTSSSTTAVTSYPHTQANLVRALAFGLVPDELRQQTADDLAALVRVAGTHLGTGFLATPDLLPVLADHGHLDVAYELLLQDTAPSWLVMIDRGATTVWERWDGIDDGRRSARVAQPLLQGRGGLVPAPARRRATAARADLAPVPGRAASRRRDHRSRDRARHAARDDLCRLGPRGRVRAHRPRARGHARPRWCCPTAPSTSSAPGGTTL